jgi:hypothetical protein
MNVGAAVEERPFKGRAKDQEISWALAPEALKQNRSLDANSPRISP